MGRDAVWSVIAQNPRRQIGEKDNVHGDPERGVSELRIEGKDSQKKGNQWSVKRLKSRYGSQDRFVHASLLIAAEIQRDIAEPEALEVLVETGSGFRLRDPRKFRPVHLNPRDVAVYAHADVVESKVKQPLLGPVNHGTMDSPSESLHCCPRRLSRRHRT